MSTSPPLKPKEIQTRFIYPFFFNRSHAVQAYEALSHITVKARDGQPMSVWECGQPPALYQEELLDHVNKFLFQDTDRGCRYLRLSSAAGSRWFNKLHVMLAEPKLSREGSDAAGVGSEQDKTTKALTWPVSLVALAPIEIFLTNYGVGVLSIALTPKTNELDFASTTLFNYKLSQLRSQISPRLYIPHPSQDKKLWESRPALQKDRMGEPPDADSPLDQRLGVNGGSFFLGELISQVLLNPLGDLGLLAVQNQLSVYTVVRFGDEVDFEKPEIQMALSAFLAALTQIEEPTHAGAPRGAVSVTNAILNRRHWAAVGLLGLTHIVSDQPAPELLYNEQRVPRVMVKYFVPYLVGLFQRTSLHRTIGEASELVLSRRSDSEIGLSKLRRHLLEFAVDGYFSEVSTRDAIHRYYQMIQDGLGVRRAFADANQAIGDIDAQHNADRQAKLAGTMADNVNATRSLQEQMNEHLRVLVDVQTMVGWIEVFFISVYLADLWDMFASHVERLHAWIPHGVIASAAIGALAGGLILKPWKHGAAKPPS